MKDSNESIFTSYVRQKVKDNEEVSPSEMLSFFQNSSQIVTESVCLEKKEWKKIVNGFRKSVLLDKIKGAKKVESLEYSIDCAKSLRKDSFDQYETLLSYGSYCMMHPTIEGLRIYCAYKDYCDAYDHISMDFNKSILMRPSNRALISTILDMEDHLNGLKEENQDLVSHVSQMVQIEEQNSKRLVK